jgi:hypothetical protein
MIDKNINLVPKFVGFFPKENNYNNPFRDEGLSEICSISECLREGPKNWIDSWKHNELGFYDAENIVYDLIKNNIEQYTIFAYKLFLFCYENGNLKNKSKMISRATDINISEKLTYYTPIGFDIVNSSEGDFFECSAMTCNGGFKKYKINKYGLLDDLGFAIGVLKEISEGHYEPGEQYLLEVYKKLGSI